MRVDVVVVGGGHAGLEAALVSARMGMQTALLTMDVGKVVAISCNPSVGGLGKSQIVAEVGALGGAMPWLADRCALQYKMLNRSKGVAVWSLRAQIDKEQYCREATALAMGMEGLDLVEDLVVDLLVGEGAVEGVVGASGTTYRARSVVLCTGTFLGGSIYLGKERQTAGRIGEGSATDLAKAIRGYGFHVGRLKTGTPARVAEESLDFDRMQRDDGEEALSFSGDRSLCQNPSQPCYVTHTNVETHKILLASKEKSPLYSGDIEGVGPRYCPSIEDKVVRFAGRERHQVVLEPESLETNHWYVNGLSTCMPLEVQEQFMRTCSGLEQVKIVKPGYAVEYDFIDPRHLKPSLETRFLSGLFFAGQVNGSSGYEEAAGQGLLAGANAALHAKGKKPFHLNRQESYIGVMVDDLVLKGTLEPYRMFTSRAENRLGLRADNADLRLRERGYELGLVDEASYAVFRKRKEAVASWRERSKKLVWNERALGLVRLVRPGKGSKKALLGKAIEKAFLRPEFEFESLVDGCANHYGVERSVATTVGAELKYAGYIAKHERHWNQLQKRWGRALPVDLDYGSVVGLRNEAVESFDRVKPETLEAAFRIPGITPVDVHVVWLYVEGGEGEGRHVSAKREQR